jgi:1-deoxy-D-xylulose-5-phosphate synthase
MVAPGTLFEELGFNYFGPVDGHDVVELVQVLRNLHAMKGPLLLHTITQKGKGYKPAEEDQLALHAVTPFDPETGKKLSSSGGGGPTYTQVFGDWLCDMAEQDPKLAAITPAMREGSGMVEFHERFPDQYFDVGIAEQHSVTLAAGLACEGIKPVVAIYSTFLQRAYDQLVHDVVLQKLPVLFAIDRAGVVGPDGPTHAGSFDISYMRCLPDLLIMAPADENECRQMLYTGHCFNGPAAVRYPRGTGPGVAVQKIMQALPIGEGEIRREGGHRIALLAFGTLVAPAEAIGEELDASVVNMRFIKPLDEQLIVRMAAEHDLLVTLEENAVAGGAGEAIASVLHEHDIQRPVLHLGLPDRFLEHGSREQLLAEAGLDEVGIRRQINAFIKAHTMEKVRPVGRAS